VGKCTGEIGLSHPGRAHDEDHLVLFDPVALAELQDRLSLEATGTAEVDVLDNSGSFNFAAFNMRVSRLLPRARSSLSTSKPRRSSKARLA
jgi:hypothetical protein